MAAYLVALKADWWVEWKAVWRVEWMAGQKACCWVVL